MNGCSSLGKVYIHPHSSLYAELVNNNRIQALQPLIQLHIVTVSFHLPQAKSSFSDLFLANIDGTCSCDLGAVLYKVLNILYKANGTDC